MPLAWLLLEAVAVAASAAVAVHRVQVDKEKGVGLRSRLVGVVAPQEREQEEKVEDGSWGGGVEDSVHIQVAWVVLLEVGACHGDVGARGMAVVLVEGDQVAHKGQAVDKDAADKD